MDDKVIFEEDQYPRVQQHVVAPTGIVGYMIRKGWIKNSAQATLVLLGVLIFCIVVIVAAFFITRSGGEGNDIDPDLLLPPDMRTPPSSA